MVLDLGERFNSEKRGNFDVSPEYCVPRIQQLILGGVAECHTQLEIRL